MEAQSHFFQHGHQSLSELDDYRQKLSEEAGFLYAFPSNNQSRSAFARLEKVLRGPGVSQPGGINTAFVARLPGMGNSAGTRVCTQMSQDSQGGFFLGKANIEGGNI